MARYTLSFAEQLLVPGYTSFLVHREPIERFVSGYIDKCINSKACYDCHKNITCYIQKQYKRLMLYGNGFRVDTDHDFEDFHFVPQTWLCRLNETFYSYRQIKYESGPNLERMVDGIIKVLKDACVEEPLLQRIRSEMMEGRTGHTTRNSPSRTKYEDEIRNNPETAALLMKMYYYDYVTFGYPLPAVVQ